MDAHAQGADALIGLTIGNYVVRHKLGEGGMGSVYLAEHPAIGKKVALKVLHAEFSARQEVINRFFNEAKSVNDIQHPNIVDIVDFGSLPAGPHGEPIVYFIMEFLGGRSLAELIKAEAPLAPERALTLALQMADALAASHKKGIVHRDLKPDNVMLVQRGRDRDFVKLLDFGIAKLTGDKPAGSSRTRTGIVMGTPHYMSPEQCEGRGNVDFPTDIYALGIVLYEMLTRQVPFAGEGYGEVLVQHLTMPPIPPSGINKQIGPHLEQVILKALEKKPDQRYPAMEEMMLALADPVGYVERHGGLAGFLAAPLAVSNMALPTIRLTPSPLTPLTPVPGSLSAAGQQTTLGAAAAETMATTPPPAKRKTGMILGVALFVAAAGGGAAAVFLGGGGDEAKAPATEPAAEPEASEVKPAEPEVKPAEPEVKPAEPEVKPTPTPPGQTPKVVIVIESSPPGAQVFFGKEKKPRGVTPYRAELDRSEAKVPVKLALKGHTSETRTIELTADTTLEIELEKEQRHGTGKGKPGDGKKGGEDDAAGSDDTLNPFDRKKKGTPP